jgi:YVTN family beta-propeller protein
MTKANSVYQKHSLPLLIVLALISACFPAAGDGYLSPQSLVVDGDLLYVAGATGKRVVVFDIKHNSMAKTITLPENPGGLALSADGAILYVAAAIPEGRIYAIDTVSGEIKKTIRVGHTPTALVINHEGSKLFVCNRFSNDVSVIDLQTGEEIKRIAVSREPVAAALSPDGSTLLVSNLLPAGAADVGQSAAVVSIIDSRSLEVSGEIALPNGGISLRGICFSPDGKYAYAVHMLARYQLPTTQVERGWMNTNALSIIGVAERRIMNTVLLDEVDLGAANPWDVVCSSDGSQLYVSHAGTHEISVIDLVEMHGKLDRLAGGDRIYNLPMEDGGGLFTEQDTPNELSFLVGMRRRVKLDGNGPRGIAVVGKKVYVAEYFTDSLGVVDCGDKEFPQVRSLLLGPEIALTSVRRGEMLFHDAANCFQEWQSCASCHPGGARTDALNWDLLNDGIGNPKNTKSLLLAHQTPPAMITGIRPKAETAVRAGLKYIQFVQYQEADAAAIDEYLKSLQPVVSPLLVEGKLSQAAKRGSELFKKTGCIRCHPAPLYTDMRKHDVGMGTGMEEGRQFDTPTLVEVWRTAPYLYDGRTTSIKQVLTTLNLDDKHGKTSELSNKQIEDLAEFVLSL